MKINYLLLFLLFFPFKAVIAQLNINTELRPRFEHRHGFGEPFSEKDKAAAFISQRTRTNFDFQSETLDLHLSFQNIRVWGDVPQLNKNDENGIAMHQAWAKWKLSKNSAFKIGRQEFVYDNSRILGNVGWAQQARSHDALLFTTSSSKIKFHVAIAYNQDGEAIQGNFLNEPKTYKALQFAWLSHTGKQFSWTALVLNNGLQSQPNVNKKEGSIKYSQTVGSTLTVKKGLFNWFGEAYYQGGKDKNDASLKAFLLGSELNYTITPKIKLGIGFEILSGNDQVDNTARVNKAFTPFYGTNHKFNGLMDYFYVGNHANSVGLVDLFLHLKLNPSPKVSYLFRMHRFSSSGKLDSLNNQQLGTEFDFVYTRKINKSIALAAGYSHFFDTQGLRQLRNLDSKNTNQWAWLMLTFKPVLFQSLTSK